MKDVQGLNFFGYVKSNPLKYTDPTGLDWWYLSHPDGGVDLYWREPGTLPPYELDGRSWRLANWGMRFTVTYCSGDYAKLSGQDVEVVDPYEHSAKAFAVHPNASPWYESLIAGFHEFLSSDWHLMMMATGAPPIDVQESIIYEDSLAQHPIAHRIGYWVPQILLVLPLIYRGGAMAAERLAARRAAEAADQARYAYRMGEWPNQGGEFLDDGVDRVAPAPAPRNTVPSSPPEQQELPFDPPAAVGTGRQMELPFEPRAGRSSIPTTTPEQTASSRNTAQGELPFMPEQQPLPLTSEPVEPPHLPKFDGKTDGVLIPVKPSGPPVKFRSNAGTGARMPFARADGHVETQGALWMKKNGITEAKMYHNHPEGICPNCINFLDWFLEEDSVLHVISPQDAIPKTPRWRVYPVTIVGKKGDPY